MRRFNRCFFVALIAACAMLVPLSARCQPAIYNLGTLGASYSAGYAVNGNGQVPGSSAVTNGAKHAFRYTGGSMADLGTLGGTNSYGQGMNSIGQAVGYSEVAGGAQHAFLYSGTPGSGGKMADPRDAWRVDKLRLRHKRQRTSGW
jgi:probable HAF family extracellular repeat protein